MEKRSRNMLIIIIIKVIPHDTGPPFAPCWCAEHEQSLMRYMKLPRKKEDKSRIETNEELHNMRKKFHQVRQGWIGICH